MDLQRLGDYDILEEVGVGTLGTTYLAKHRYLNERVILKLLPEELASNDEFVSAFEAKIASIAKLDHPHIVSMQNVCHADGRYFLVMEEIIDEDALASNLETFLQKRQILSDEEILSILKQVAEALDYAHSKGEDGKPLGHFGLKLNNILVSPQEQKKHHITLTDFGLTDIIGAKEVLSRTCYNVAHSLGLSHVLQDHYSAVAVETKVHTALQQSFLQTFSFLAPEQKTDEPVSYLADSYSFGVLAYYLICRKYPEGVFPLPSKAKPEYRLNWDELVIECLQQDPQLRPKELRFALETVLKPKVMSRGNEKIDEWNKITQPKKADPVSTAPSVQLVSALREKAEDTKAGMTLGETLASKLSSPVHTPSSAVRPMDNPPKAPAGPDPSKIFHKEMTVTHYSPKKIEGRVIEPLIGKRVLIPGGEYLRGSDTGARDETPKHKVYLKSFYLDVHPITNEQFIRFLEWIDSEKDECNNDIIRLRESRIKRTAGRLLIESGYAKHPVVGVTWYGAVAYAKWVGKRLPTEAEWEIASCGGVEESLFPTGADIERVQANYFSSDTTPVMSYPATGYGLYDMAGNVYEWCHDWYDFHYYNVSLLEPNDPKGPPQGVYRVLRGGCWKSLKEDLRCCHRHRNNPGTLNGTYGFRLASDAE